MHTKPLYQAQKLIQHQKHLERLKKISGKKSQKSQYNPNRNTLDQMHRIRNKSTDFQIKQKNQLLNFENNKILSKLLQISERKQIPAYSTIASHCVTKKQSNIIMFNNPQRKKRQLQILQTNNKLARRLLTKQSEFDRTKILKDIQQYEGVRKVLQHNRRIKLVPMLRQNGGYEFSRISTTQNSRINSKSAQNITNQVSLGHIEQQ